MCSTNECIINKSSFLNRSISNINKTTIDYLRENQHKNHLANLEDKKKIKTKIVFLMQKLAKV